MDRDFIDRSALVKRYAALAREFEPVNADSMGDGVFDDPNATITDKLHYASTDNDDCKLDPDFIDRALRAFDELPEEARRTLLNGWRPIDHDRRARGIDVLAALATDAPIARVVVFAADVEMMPGGKCLKEMRCSHFQDWMPLAAPQSVQLIVREGTPRAHVMCVLGQLLNQTMEAWEALINAAPIGVYRRRGGQVWQAYDFDECFDGFLVTAENDVNRPIAYVSASGIDGLTENDAEDIASRIAESPYGDFHRAAIDLRTFGYENSPQPTPGFLYGLQLEPIDRALVQGEQRIVPRPYCRFLARHLTELAAHVPHSDCVDVYEPARENGGSPNRPNAPQLAGNGSGKAVATAAG